MTEERKKPLIKPLSTTSGILGLIQGVCWTIFSVLCMLSYYDAVQLDTNSASFANETAYYKLIYNIFLDNNDHYDLPSDRLVKPREFFIFMWFYLVFSVLWSLISGTIIWAMIHNQWHLTKGLFGSWSTITILTSIVDIVLMSLLVVDYIKVETRTDFIPVCYGIMMSLSARGYALWIINIIFAAIMTKYTLNVVLKDDSPTLPIIHGFESSAITPPWFDVSVKSFWENGHDNPGFTAENKSHAHNAPSNIYSELAKGASSYVNKAPTPPKEPPYVNRAPNNSGETMSFAQAIANRTATIGRGKGRRSPLYNVPPPVIPDPDYTPPSSPIGKSVLRRETNYNEVY